MLPTFFASAFAQQVAAAAVTAAWQGSIIAVGLAICLRLVPRTSAEQRFTLWAAAFTSIVSLPLVTIVARSMTAGAATNLPANAAQPLFSQPSIRPFVSLDARWSFAIAALWAVAALFRAVDLVIHSARLRKIWKQALPAELDGRLIALLAATPAGKSRWPVEVCTTTTLQRPSVIGFFKPRILIPDWLLERLTAGELEQIVLHEAEHLRRRDDWTNLFQKLCLVLFPLNPALVWIERRLCREREMACDDGVIAITRAPRAYAACLTSLAERGLQRRAEALSLGAWQRRPELVHRVHSILRRTHALGPVGSRVFLGALGCGLLFGSVALARCPQLVVFVSTPKPDAASSNGPNNRQITAARLINASYVEERTAGKGRVLSCANAKTRRTDSSANGGIQIEEERVFVEPSVVQQNVALVSKTAPHDANRQDPPPVFLKAEMQSAQTPRAQDQQWFVVTTWEQVEIPNQNTGLKADYDTAAKENPSSDPNAAGMASASADGSVPQTVQPAGQIMVTRLILKIYPASSVSTQPTTLPIRGGWFVLQL